MLLTTTVTSLKRGKKDIKSTRRQVVTVVCPSLYTGDKAFYLKCDKAVWNDKMLSHNYRAFAGWGTNNLFKVALTLCLDYICAYVTSQSRTSSYLPNRLNLSLSHVHLIRHRARSESVFINSIFKESKILLQWLLYSQQLICSLTVMFASTL